MQVCQTAGMTTNAAALLGEMGGPAGLPARPADDLDPYLDAALVCVERYGWSRTSARDIAREAGVERSTIYRHLGAREQILRLLIAREVHRLIDHASAVALTGQGGPSMVVELVAAAIEYVWSLPAIAKLIEDDPDLLAGFLARGIPDVIDRFTDALSPALDSVMAVGVVARHDPVLVTQWVVRVAISVLMAPPPGDLRTFLAAVLDPLLDPEAA